MANPRQVSLRSAAGESFKRLLVLAIVLGIFFRFWQIDRKVYWIDEVHTSLRSVGYSRSEFVEQVPRDRRLSIDEFHQFQRLSPERGWDDSLNALAQNAEHTPLYYVCVRLAMSLLGSSVAVTRSVAAVFSLLCLPVVYYFCRLLEEAGFPNGQAEGSRHRISLIGSLSVILLALSPLQILYAQEARQYSLYGLMTLVSSAALLHCLRRQAANSPAANPPTANSPAANSPAANSPALEQSVAHQTGFWATWWPYAISASLLLYSHLIGALVLFTQGIYTLLTQRRAWRGQLLSVGVALVSLLPWVALYFANASYIGAWTGRDIGLGTLAQRWLLNLSSVWFDWQVRFPGQQLFDVERGQDFAALAQPGIWLSFGLVAGAIASLFLMQRQLPARSAQLIWLLLLLPSGLLLIPDLLSGGQRTGIARYLLPSYLSITIATAAGLAWLLSQQRRWLGISLRHWGRSLLACLLLLSLWSNAASAQADTWWNKYSCFYDAAVAKQINQAENAIVISSPRRASRLLALSYQLEADIPLWFVSDRSNREELGNEESAPAPLLLPEQFQTLFLFRPSGELFQALSEGSAYAVEPVLEEGHLWKVNVLSPMATSAANPMRRCVELLQ